MKYQEYKELSDAMEQAAHKFYQLRYQMSNGGNLSMRAPGHDWMLVKAPMASSPAHRAAIPILHRVQNAPSSSLLCCRAASRPSAPT